MSNSVIVAILVSLLVNEILGATDWLADRIIRLAARRWLARTGHDRLADLREDLAHSPGRLFKLVTASWMLLATFVDPDRLTFNFPSLWRWSRPVRVAVRDLFAGALDAVRRRQAASPPARRHLLAIRTVVSLLPRSHRRLYAEEWTAELHVMTKRERTAFTTGLVLGAPYMAVALRRRVRPPR